MSRVKRGLTAHARHKKILKMAKGYRGRNKNVFRVAVEKVEKGLQYAYRDRKAKKRSLKQKRPGQRVLRRSRIRRESRERKTGRRP